MQHPEQTLDIRRLRVLRLLLASSSVSRTAELLGQSQPAISAHLRRLRDIIGDPLLVRSGTHMVPTERGAALLPVVQRVLEDIGAITELGGTFDPGRSHRRVRIVAANCFGPFFLPRIAALICSEAPRITVDFLSMQADVEVMHGLEAGEIDVVIGNWPAPPDRLRFAPLFATDIVCVVRRGHPVAGRCTLSLETYLTLDHLSPTPRSLVAWSPIDGRLNEMHMRRRVAVSVPKYTIAASILAHTDLVFTTGRPFAEHLASSMPLVLLRAPLELGQMNFFMLWHERSHASPFSQWLRGIIRAIAADLERCGGGARIRHEPASPPVAPALAG